MEQFRIEDVQKAIVKSRRKVKIFKAYEYDSDSKAYIYCGTFEAPQNTPDHRLSEYIEDDF